MNAERQDGGRAAVTSLSAVTTRGQQRLLSLAIARVRKQELPVHEPPEVLAGPGHEEMCSLCDEPISEAQIEYEVSAGEADVPARSILYFHIRCYDAWVKACRLSVTG